MIKFIKFCLFIFLFISLVACGDDGDCLADDYVGNWSGSVKCEGEDVEPTSLVIRAGTAPDEIILDDGETEYTLNVNGCKIVIERQTIDLLGLELEVEGDGELDGDNLIIRQKTRFIGITQECEVELTR